MTVLAPTTVTDLRFDTDPSSCADIVDFVECVRNQLPAGSRLSDIHVDTARPPMFVVNDRLIRSNAGDVPTQLVEDAISRMSSYARNKFERDQDADGRFKLSDSALVRMHAYMCDDAASLTLRLQPPRPFRWDEMGLPNHLLDLLDRPQGLVIFVGPVGSRKTAALNAMLDHVNRKHPPKHVVTVEDPPEFTHTPINGYFHQREIGHTTPSYRTAIEGALRMRPDFLIVGEARDGDTIDAALLASKLGRLCMTSMHVETTTEAIMRISQSFSGSKRDEVMATFESSMLAIVALRPVPTVNGDIVLAYEILRNTKATRPNLSDPLKLRGMLLEGDNMIRMESCLERLYRDGKITRETAIAFAPDPDALADI